MLIAQAKKKENIVEYVIYMFQLQDMLRGIKFDPEFIRYNIAHQMSQDEQVREDIYKWYIDLASKMKKEGLEESGYTTSLNETLSELIMLHGMLLQQMNDEKYIALHEKAQPFINEFREKSNDPKSNEILVCINAIYGKLLLKIKQKEISKETEEAFSAFTNLLAFLAKKYKDIFSQSMGVLSN